MTLPEHLNDLRHLPFFQISRQRDKHKPKENSLKIDKHWIAQVMFLAYARLKCV